MLKKMKNWFKSKPKITGEEYTAREVNEEIERNREISLTFHMPREAFKEMLPVMEQGLIFPIVFGEQEIRKIVKDFMIEGKSKIELDYGEK